jgi:hypothetical protein
MSNLMFVLSLIFILVMIGVGPLLTILSLNALFGLQIALNFWSWLSVAWLSLIGVGIVREGVRSGIRSGN